MRTQMTAHAIAAPISLTRITDCGGGYD
jgi:hypothetical protein